VVLASNGPDAIEILRQQSIDVVLLDVQMPGMDGPQTLTVLNELQIPVRCCFVTGNIGKYTSDELLRLGATGIVQKPFQLHELHEAIVHALRSNR
jgi:CheY-like chemotaxis protein